ncbi:vegetative cell wall protein gp1-like [Megalops cyprinoides]|uniref:vegetative cell wall protein gp1-like n=1 Tax=Megalops cyprinoides TaxID=118141 RepID=UPI001864B4D7|nr:vegetative cell wall protein gp1-like [Megalops cyprinoides]
MERNYSGKAGRIGWQALGRLLGQWQFLAKVSSPPTVSSPHATDSTRPFVWCGSNFMTLTAKESEYPHLQVDRVSAPPLSLSQLPSYCGHTFQLTANDFVLMAPYDGCYVLKEDGSYVLPLLWWETPVKMVCPATPAPAPSSSPPSPLSVSCTPFAMALKIQGGMDAARKLQVASQGEWVPFVPSQCGYHAEYHPGDLIIYAPYTGCGITVKDGMYTLSFLAQEGKMTISCPPPLVPSPQIPHPSRTHPTHSLIVPNYPPISDPLVAPIYYYDPSLYADLQKGPPTHPPTPAPTRNTPLFPAYHPHTSIDLSVAPPSLFSKNSYHDPKLHAHQSAYPLCTPFGPTPCIASPYDPAPSVPLPHWPQIPTTPSSTSTSQSSPSLTCTTDDMTVTLPSAHPDSIVVIDHNNMWMSIASAPPGCYYKLRTDGKKGVTLSSPLPACHTFTPVSQQCYNRLDMTHAPLPPPPLL